jgi:uncharacterized protein (DUF1684 family)
MKSSIPMSTNTLALVLLVAACAGCGRTWPEPPPVEPAKYQEDYKTWREERQETLLFAVKILGVWPLESGDNAFGSDRSLSIVLPARVSPARAGSFHFVGNKVEVVPAPGVPLRHGDSLLKAPAEVEEVALGSVTMQIFSMGEGPTERRFVTASDDMHPALEHLAPIETFPVDPRWRVAARFDAYQAPRSVRIADVRGGATEMSAPGDLVFRVNGQEQRLMAIASPESNEFFVMFKDPTNLSTTYGGYRMLHPQAVGDGGWTVLDFNIASNPPCAYSPYTTCPLPPPQNRLQVAIEAGEKRHPTAHGFQ